MASIAASPTLSKPMVSLRIVYFLMMTSNEKKVMSMMSRELFAAATESLPLNFSPSIREEQTATITSLPTEMLMSICDYLPIADVLSLSSTSSSFRDGRLLADRLYVNVYNLSRIFVESKMFEAVLRANLTHVDESEWKYWRDFSAYRVQPRKAHLSERSRLTEVIVAAENRVCLSHDSLRVIYVTTHTASNRVLDEDEEMMEAMIDDMVCNTNIDRVYVPKRIGEVQPMCYAISLSLLAIVLSVFPFAGIIIAICLAVMGNALWWISLIPATVFMPCAVTMVAFAVRGWVSTMRVMKRIVVGGDENV